MAEEEEKMLQLKVGGKFSVRFSFEDLDLKCPVCRENIVDAPIFVCDNDHPLCLQCHRLRYSTNG